MKRLARLGLALALSLIGAGCGTSATVDVASEASATTEPVGAAADAPETTAEAAQDADNADGPGVYEVSIVNAHGAQPFSPPAWAVHNGDYDMIEIGEPVSYGVKEVAENADGQPLAFALSLGVDGVYESGLASGGAASGTGPILPGTSRTWQITAVEGSRLFSFVAMIGCTNDGLILADSVSLPIDVGSALTFPLVGYDAGTEINDENLDHMMPPCSQGARGSFLSDPTLAENGVLSLHPGITGDGDLPIAEWGWDDPIGELIITRAG